jgi:hypothetical protein
MVGMMRAIFADTLCTEFMQGDGPTSLPNTLPPLCKLLRKVIIKAKRSAHDQLIPPAPDANASTTEMKRFMVQKRMEAEERSVVKGSVIKGSVMKGSVMKVHYESTLPHVGRRAVRCAFSDKNGVLVVRFW